MTLPKTVRYPGIIPEPCDKPATDRNWDALRRILNDIGEDIEAPGPAVERIRLTATLSPGSSAAAVKLTYTGGAWTAGDAITVHDDLPTGPWQGISGYEGWGRERTTDDGETNYSLVWLERIATTIWGTLGGALSGGSAANSAVTNYSDGASPGATVTVYDRNGRFPDAIAGAFFVAIYDFEAQRYELTQCQQPEWVATATAAQDFGSSTLTVNIMGFTPKSYSELDDTGPVPTTARNTFGLTGFAGDLMHIQKSAVDDIWEILVPDKRPGGGGGGGGTVVFFQLTDELQIGGNSAAVTSDGIEITVYDPYGTTGFRGMWTGIPGFRGFARIRDEDPHSADIIWMEQFARYIHFQLSEDMSGGEADANVAYAFGQGISPGGSVTVHDDGDKFRYALSGAWGTAIRNEYLNTDDPFTPYYSIVICDQTALYGGAQLTADMCGGAAGVTQYKGWSTFPHGQTPPLGTVNNAENPFALAGRASEPVLLLFKDDGAAGGYVVGQAVHKEKEVVIDNRFNDGCWEQKKQKFYLMECADPGEFTPYICGLDCPA